MWSRLKLFVTIASMGAGLTLLFEGLGAKEQRIVIGFLIVWQVVLYVRDNVPVKTRKKEQGDAVEASRPPGQHPGVLVLREMRTRELTISATAVLLGVGRHKVSRVVNGHRAIDADLALRLDGVGFGKDVDWLMRQAQYDLAVARERLFDQAA